MRGKYSPTVSHAYYKDQKWWKKYAYAGYTADDFVMYDPDGFDSYGYNKDDIDRAGNKEWAYYHDDSTEGNDAYNDAYDRWSFDGVKPVKTY